MVGLRPTSTWLRASLVAQGLKRLSPTLETWVRSLGWEDPLEKEMVTHSSILAWRIPWTEKPGRLQSTGSQRVGHDWTTSLTHSLTIWLKVKMYFFFFFNIFLSGSYPWKCLDVRKGWYLVLLPLPPHSYIWLLFNIHLNQHFIGIYCVPCTVLSLVVE